MEEVLNRFRDNRETALESPSVVHAALDRYRSSRKLNFSDCVTLEIARRAGHVPMATFDQALGKAKGTCRVE